MDAQSKIHKASEILKQGGVIICPTEGIYGISCMANNIDAIKRIIEIKQRDDKKGLILVANSLDMASDFVNLDKVPQSSIDLMQELWPGHHTFVLPCKDNVSPYLTGSRDSIALRVSAFSTLLSLCSQVNYPLVSTSANISGHDPLTTIDKLNAEFKDKVDYILDLPCQGLKTSSTIHDALSGQILRKG